MSLKPANDTTPTCPTAAREIDRLCVLEALGMLPDQYIATRAYEAFYRLCPGVKR